MSSRFSIQSPYVVATLPQPLDREKGRYVVGEVFGGQPGSKKRKRAELAIGIDGEGVNLYDIASSRLITSYAVPPQAKFTCAPASTRSRISKSHTLRRTYVSCSVPHKQLRLFTENHDGPATASSKIASRNLENDSQPIVFLGTISTHAHVEQRDRISDVLAVQEDGIITCYDGEDLKTKWTSPASVLVKDDHTGSDELVIEFAQLTNVYSASQGILKSRPDLLTVFPQEVSAGGFNPELLVLITKSRDVHSLRVVAMPQRSAIGTLQQFVEVLLVVELPSQSTAISKGRTSFSLQVSSGLMQQLSVDTLQTFDLTSTIPKVVSKLRSSGAASFLRLSTSSVMLCAADEVTVYNPKYQSILATVQLNKDQDDSLKRKRSNGSKGDVAGRFDFVSYFPKLGTAVAISEDQLIAFQVEGQLDRQGRPRPAGLLIDSLGSSARDQFSTARSKRTKSVIEHELKTLDLSHLSNDNSAEISWAADVLKLDSAASKGDSNSFDELFASQLNLTWPSESKVNETLASTLPGNAQKSHTPAVSKRRHMLYALSKIFEVVETDGSRRYSIAFYPPNTFTWLLQEGFMTVANINSALKGQGVLNFSAPPGNLVDLLEDIDPSLDLLFVLVAENHLSAADYLHAIKRLMHSLGLFGESASKQAMLTNGEDNEDGGDPEEKLLRLEAEAENDLAMAEYQLDSGSGIRGQALSVALSQLYTCPSDTIVFAIQTTFSIVETISLIYLLRFELGRGAWTSRYLDLGDSNIIDEDAEIPSNAIILISSLLNNCVDAIGAGGWLTGEARLVNGDPFEAQELITSLKLEVGAALEGIEEARYLNGLISEMIRYGDQVQKVQKRQDDDSSEKKRKGKPSRPIIMPVGEQERLLPLGLKTDRLIAFQRIGAGGEIQERTKRDLGHLKSQKVGKYTRERIVV